MQATLTLTAKQLRRAADLREKIDRFSKELTAILGSSNSAPSAAKPVVAPKRKRRFSKATLAKLTAAVKARWVQAKASGKTSLAATRLKKK